MDTTLERLNWSATSLLPTFQPLQQLAVYDLRGSSQEVQLAATTLIGLINRPQPRVYALTGEDDAYWLKEVFGKVPQERAPQTADAVLSALLKEYPSVVQGIIIYDPALPDTINIATTMAGQRSGLIASPALAQDLQASYQLPVLVDLRSYGWQSRGQAYAWALQNLLADASARLIAGLDPQGVTWLRSYLVATNTFVYWLDSRKYMPDRRLGGLSERALMRQILQRFSPGAAHLGWFIQENSGVALTSLVGMAVYASDFCTNLEVWSAFPTTSSPQPPAKRPVPLLKRDKIYLSFTMSEGDNLQYCQHHMLGCWRDSQRGKLPIGWTFSPALLETFPALAAYYLDSATESDEFLAGPSGIGYMFPSVWPQEQLPSFLEQTGKAMQALGMSTLEILDSGPFYRSGLPWLSKVSLDGMAFIHSQRQKLFAETLASYGVQGMVSGTGFLINTGAFKQAGGMPVYHNLGLAGSIEQAVKIVQRAARIEKQRPLFLNLYVLAWNMNPTHLQEVVNRLGAEYEIVLPRELLSLSAQ